MLKQGVKISLPIFNIIAADSLQACWKKELYVITWKLIQAARFSNPQQPESLF